MTSVSRSDSRVQPVEGAHPARTPLRAVPSSVDSRRAESAADDQRVQAVALDLDGVVCRFLPARRLAALAKLTGLAASEVDQRLFGRSGFAQDCDAGRYDLDEALAIAASALSYQATPKRCTADGWRPSSPIRPPSRLSTQFASRSLQHCSATATRSSALATELEYIAERFDFLFLSCKLGQLKPARTAFDAVTALLELEPCEVVLVDDSRSNVDAARRFGWSSVRFTNPASLVAALEEFGVR